MLAGIAGIFPGCMTTGGGFSEQPRLAALVQSPPDYSIYAARREKDRNLAAQQGFSLDGSYVLAAEISESSRMEDPRLERAFAEFNARLIPGEVAGAPIGNFYVSGNPSYNAVALETGDIIVNRGATEARYADELAFLLGHESSHILSDHYKDRERRDQVNKILGGLLFVAVLADGFSNGGKTGKVSNYAVGAAFGAVALNELSGQAWAAKQEAEADQLGLELLVARDYSPNGAITLLEKLRDTERLQRDEQTALLEARCGKRQSAGDQFARSLMEGIVGPAAPDPADKDPVCQQWNSLSTQLFESKTLAGEKRVSSMQEYIAFRYPDLKSQKSMQEFLDKNGRPTTFLAQISPDGQVARANAADRVISLVNQGRIDEARPLTRKLLNSKNDAMPAARWALYLFGSATGDPKAVEHLEFAFKANTANNTMLHTLIQEYERRFNYEGALDVVRRLQKRTTEQASTEYPSEIRYLRLLGRTDEIPPVIEKCKAAKIKTLTTACLKEAEMDKEDSASEAIKTSFAIDVFAEAVAGTELSALLDRSSDYTLFVPTNAALAEYFGGDARRALLPENREKLRELVAAHIIPGRMSNGHEAVHGELGKLRVGQLEEMGGAVIGHPIEVKDASILVIDSVLPLANPGF